MKNEKKIKHEGDVISHVHANTNEVEMKLNPKLIRPHPTIFVQLETLAPENYHISYDDNKKSINFTKVSKELAGNT